MNFANNTADRDKIIAGVGTPGINNWSDLNKVGINNANEWYSDLTNKIAQQFVTPILTVRLAMRRHHFRGEFVYGDWFNMVWSGLYNVLAYNQNAYTPKDLIADGHNLKPPMFTQNVPQYIELSIAMALDEKLVRGFVTSGTVPALNQLISNVMRAVPMTLNWYMYHFEIKCLKQIKNVYKLTTRYPKPADVTNLTQWKLAYLQNLINNMRQPSIGEYQFLGKIGDQDPRTTDKKALAKTDFAPVALDQPLIAYTSPQQDAEFRTLGYSTTFNPEFLRLKDVTFENLNINKAQEASGKEIIDTFGTSTFLWGKNVKAAAPADDYQTVYLVAPDAFGIMDRFRVTTASTWVNGQYVQTLTLFTTYTPMWQNIAVKVDLRTA